MPRHYPNPSEPSGRTLGDEELAALREVIDSARLNFTVGGTKVAELEREFARMTGTQHAVACSSGTAALHLAVGAVDPAPGDEIITAPITDFGTVIGVLAQNAVPVFADVDASTGVLTVETVEAAISERTRAIIAVHLFGATAPVAELRELANRHCIVLIEDCAQAYLATLPDGRNVGTVGQLGCFSLQQYKHITSGDGGLVTTDDPELATRMRLFADKGWPRESGERMHVSFGLNYRMTELQAAVAGAQLPKLAGVVERRRRTAARLAAALRDVPGVSVPDDNTLKRHSVWLFPVLLDLDRSGGDNRAYTDRLATEGIPANPGYLSRPVYANPIFTEQRIYGDSGFPFQSPPARKNWTYEPGLCPNAERLIDSAWFTIGWNEGYTDDDVDAIAEAMTRINAELRAEAGQAGQAGQAGSGSGTTERPEAAAS